MIIDEILRDRTPEERALIARRTLVFSAKIVCLCARGVGVTDDRLKGLLLAMRSPEIEMLTDLEALDLMRHLGIERA